MKHTKRYGFTGEQKVVEGVILKRICAVKDFYALEPYDAGADYNQFEFELIAKGTLGGWLMSGDNLSQEGFAWVRDDACVYGEAKVSDGALIYGEAKVYENAVVMNCAMVYDKAQVHGTAEVCGHAMVYGQANVSVGVLAERVQVYDNASLYGDGAIHVCDYAEVHDSAVVRSGTGCTVMIEQSAMVCGEAQIFGGYEEETTITQNARVEDRALVCMGAKIQGEARVCDTAKIVGATIDGKALICAETVVPQGVYIGGNAMVGLASSSYDGGYLQSGLRLYGDAMVMSSADYLMMGPIWVGDMIPKKLVFSLTQNRQIMMTILLCMGDREPICLGREYYLIGNPKALKRKLANAKLRYDNGVIEPLHPALVGEILKNAEYARKYFARRLHELRRLVRLEEAEQTDLTESMEPLEWTDLERWIDELY